MCADEPVIEIGWVSLLAVPWFKCIRRTSCHHIHSSYFNFLRAEYVDWMLTVIIGGLVFTAAISSVLGGSCHCDSCSRWVITGVHLLCWMGGFANHSAMSK